MTSLVIPRWVRQKRAKRRPKTDGLEQFCRRSIAHYKIPKYWKFVSAFSMTVTGKIRKVEMRELAIEELGLQEVTRVKTS